MAKRDRRSGIVQCTFSLHNYDAICCDIGDVLFYDFPIKLAFSYYFHSHVTRYHSGLDIGPWQILSAEGRHQGELLQLEYDTWAVANDRAWSAVLEQWGSLFHAIPAAHTALSQLGSKRVALVANQPAIVLDSLERHGITQLVDHVILDTCHGISKPDIGLYKLALQRLDACAGDSVMIGDRLDNDVVPAKSLGMCAIWTRPLPYDPALPVPQVPRSWRIRYEDGLAHQQSLAWAAHAALPLAKKPDMVVESLGALCPDG